MGETKINYPMEGITLPIYPGDILYTKALKTFSMASHSNDRVEMVVETVTVTKTGVILDIKPLFPREYRYPLHTIHVDQIGVTHFKSKKEYDDFHHKGVRGRAKDWERKGHALK